MHNERKILSYIRHKGSASKSEIAQQLGLSAQAVTVIIKSLEAEELVVRKAPKRGKVGQPIVPFSLNPDGAFGIGLKVGRRSFDLTLVDMTGNVKGTLHENCAYPTVSQLLLFIKKGVEVLTLSLEADHAHRITGIGVAMPYEIWSWAEEAGAPKEVLDEWKSFDFSLKIGSIINLPIYVCNDDTAACSAELSFGNINHFSDFLYIFVGTFIGGGIVINGSLFTGKTGNAGAIGSLPQPSINESGKLVSKQLIMQSSLFILEKMLRDADIDSSVLWRSTDYWGKLGTPLEHWIEQVTDGLAYAALCSLAVFDFEAVIIDGAIPATVRENIVQITREKIKRADTRGLSSTKVVSGSIGPKAQSIGSANLPLLVHFSHDSQHIFSK